MKTVRLALCAMAMLTIGCGSDEFCPAPGNNFNANSNQPGNNTTPARIASTAFNFRDISAAQGLNPGDDAVVNVSLPFTLRWNGQNLTTLNVGSNGFLHAGGANPTFLNTQLPDLSSPDPLLAVYWTDLQGPGSNWIFTDTQGTAPNRDFLVMWKDARSPLASANGVTFEVVIHESGGLELQYQDTDFGDPSLNSGAAATVGFQVGGLGATWCFNGSPNNVPSNSGLLVSP